MTFQEALKLAATITELVSVAAPGISEIIRGVKVEQDESGKWNIRLALDDVEEKVEENISQAEDWLSEHS
ncbi:hypothetical protein MYX75_01115 [Acidobacteria bacterium AH-259-A15]|nr:hypothetical protein [Acidobacteria bacterium AH-259-A15]